MSRLDEIAATGNRGHRRTENNWIMCADGTRLSAIAGGGAYCTPRPAFCVCEGVPDWPPYPPHGGEVAHDYPGPYTAVEIWADDEDDVRGYVPVNEVRALIAAHGGEVA